MKNKRLAINMIAQIVAFCTNIGISFFLTPFIVKNVGKEAYGFVGLSNDFISYAQILTVALNSMAGRFITISINKKDKYSANKYFTTVIIANIILSIIIIIPFSFIIININNILNIPNNILNDVRFLYSCVFINFIISILGSVFSIATFAKNRLDMSSIRNIEANFIKVIVLVILFSMFKPSVWYIGLATLVSTIFIIYTNIKYTNRLLPEINVKKEYFDLKYLKELLSAGIWNSLTRLSSILNSGLNLLITNIFVGATAMGVLSIARTIPNMILSIFAMLSNTFAPQLTISYAKNDLNEIKEQLFLSMKILAIIASIPICLLVIYGDSFFLLWVPEQDANILHLLSIIISFELIFALPLESLWNIFTVVNKVKVSSIFFFIFSILTIITLFIELYFINDLNLKLLIIAGTSSFWGSIRSLTFLPIYGARCLNLKWNTFYPLIIKNVISVIIIIFIASIIKTHILTDSWIGLIFICFIISIVALIINTYIILDKKDRNNLKKIIYKYYMIIKKQ